MAHARSNLGLWLMIALLSLVAAGKAVLYDTLDPDCFWHLRVADQLHRDGIGPLVDQISFASIKDPWTPYSWLAELGMKAIWDAGGFRLAVLVQALMMGTFAFLIALCARQLQRDDNPTAIVLATAFAMYFALPYLSFRPVTFTLVLLACCTWLLLRDRRLEERSRAVWLVVPITVLITNCHFFSLLVPTWIGCLLIGSMIERRAASAVGQTFLSVSGPGPDVRTAEIAPALPDRQECLSYRIWRYSILLVTTTLACAATPMLPGMIRAMWDYQSSDPMLAAGVIAEFQPVWSGPLGMLSVALLTIWIAAVYYNRNHLRRGELLWSLICLLLVIRLGRFAPVFAPIAAAVLAARLPMLGTSAVLARRGVVAALACVLVIGLIRIVAAFPHSDTQLSAWLNRHGPDTPGYPTAAADFLVSRISHGRVINELSWGGYLAWRLGDGYQIFVDGRTQLYSPQFWRATYISRARDESAPLLRASGAEVALLPLEHSRFRGVLIGLGWQSIYHDDRAEILTPPSAMPSLGSAD